MSNPVVIRYKGLTVECYGILNEDSSIMVTCDNENEDNVVAESFKNWTDAVHTIVDSERFYSEIVQLETD